ncbi:MAG TPA: DUF6079 family protein [Pyrinomonadaceae bacterium]
MKRAQDKIKDFVEPQVFDEVQNYASDPVRSLAAYHFTDVTSDLLARWLDALADLPKTRGAARALAGLRGVGKSHTLTVFGALAAYPELRHTLTEAHVGTSARRLLSRRYIVARVERGTRESLMEEVSAALAKVFGGDEMEWEHEPSIVLAMAARMSDAPLVLLVDTAFGREGRVQRDDGPLLSELAKATEHVNAFIALALDDDIAGADGANVALSGSFQIDYLDPEHLYRIVDTHLFHKNAQARAALHDLYLTLRAAVPGFNWSEPRFTSIYPMHPLVADVAPAVRLYVPTFGFLPFAAAAGARATNRPALSLVVLDEVFDRTEYDLRKAEDLKETFTAYDDLATRAVAQFPMMQRLQAKLILKGLFILSLDGRGATARELGAALLIYDEKQPEAAVERVGEMLARFAEAASPDALRASEEGGEMRYRFRISASSGFNAALAEIVEQISSDSAALATLLRTIARARFEDWPLIENAEPERKPIEAATPAQEVDAQTSGVDFDIIWRGTVRRGRVRWQAPGTFAPPLAPASSTAADNSSAIAAGNCDWELVILSPQMFKGEAVDGSVAAIDSVAGGSAPENAVALCLQSNHPAFAVWQPAALSGEEQETLHRLLALRKDNSLFAQFGETVRAAERTHAALAERLWSNAYLDRGQLLIGNSAQAFTNEARAAATFRVALAEMLAPVFAARYPLHPEFSQTLSETEVAQLVNGLFGGANQQEASVQELAHLFAEPLGLASLRGGSYALEAGDQALKKPWVREVLAMTDAANGEVVPLDAVSRKLKSEPYGLERESQYLILAALVAQRRIELVTLNGDRISRRTLDLKLRWDEIAGVARVATLLHSAEELTAWARLLTGQTALASIAEPEARESVRVALSEWVETWRASQLLEKYEALPDEGLTTRTWGLAQAVRRSFGSAAESIEALLADTISLEEGLQRIADAFGDSLEQFKRHQDQLRKLTCFVNGLVRRIEARAYLSLAEPTALNEIESARRELLAIADDPHALFEEESNRRFDLLWREFHQRYREHYDSAHDEAMNSSARQETIETLVRRDDFREFEALSQLSIVNKSYWEEATRLLQRSRAAHCALPVRQLLITQPFCSCSFRLAHAAALKRLPQALEETLQRGLAAHRSTLSFWRNGLAQALAALAASEAAAENTERADALASTLALGEAPSPLTPFEIQLIEQALQQTAVPPLRVHLPATGYGLMTRDELAARLKQWLDDLPSYPALVDVNGEADGHGG